MAECARRASRPLEKDLPPDILELLQSTSRGVRRLYSSAGALFSTPKRYRHTHRADPLPAASTRRQQQPHRRTGKALSYLECEEGDLDDESSSEREAIALRRFSRSPGPRHCKESYVQYSSASHDDHGDYDDDEEEEDKNLSRSIDCSDGRSSSSSSRNGFLASSGGAPDPSALRTQPVLNRRSYPPAYDSADLMRSHALRSVDRVDPSKAGGVVGSRGRCSSRGHEENRNAFVTVSKYRGGAVKLHRPGGESGAGASKCRVDKALAMAARQKPHQSTRAQSRSTKSGRGATLTSAATATPPRKIPAPGDEATTTRAVWTTPGGSGRAGGSVVSSDRVLEVARDEAAFTAASSTQSSFGRKWEQTFEAISEGMRGLPCSGGPPPATVVTARGPPESAAIGSLEGATAAAVDKGVTLSPAPYGAGVCGPSDVGSTSAILATPPTASEVDGDVPKQVTQRCESEVGRTAVQRSPVLPLPPAGIVEDLLAAVRAQRDQEISALRAQLVEERQRVAQETAAHLHSSFNAATQALHAELKCSRQRVDESNRMLQEARSLTQQATDELRGARELAAEQGEELKQLRRKVLTLEMEEASAEERIRRQESEVVQLNMEVEELRRQDAESRRRVQLVEEQSRRELADAQRRIEALRGEYCATTEGYEKLLDASNVRLDEYEQQRSKFVKYRERQKRATADLQATLAEREARCTALEATVRELTERSQADQERQQRAVAVLQEERAKLSATVDDLTKRLAAQEVSSRRHAEVMEWEKRATETDANRRGEENEALREALRAFEMVKSDLEDELRRAREESVAKETAANEAAGAYRRHSEDTISALRRQLREKDAKLELLAASATEPVQKLRRQLEVERNRRATAEELCETMRKKVKDAEDAAQRELRRHQLRPSVHPTSGTLPHAGSTKSSVNATNLASRGAPRDAEPNAGPGVVLPMASIAAPRARQLAGATETTRSVPLRIAGNLSGELPGRKSNETSPLQQQIKWGVPSDFATPIPVDRTALPSYSPSVAAGSPSAPPQNLTPQQLMTLQLEERSRLYADTAATTLMVRPENTSSREAVAASPPRCDGVPLPFGSARNEWRSQPEQRSDCLLLDEASEESRRAAGRGPRAAPRSRGTSPTESLGDQHASQLSAISGNVSHGLRSNGENFWCEDDDDGMGSLGRPIALATDGPSSTGTGHRPGSAPPGISMAGSSPTPGVDDDADHERRVVEYNEGAAEVYRSIIGSQEAFLAKCAAVVRSIPTRPLKNRPVREQTAVNADRRGGGTRD